MNRPSRTDEPSKGDGYNQSPNDLSNDLTTNEDLNGISNSRVLRGGEGLTLEDTGQGAVDETIVSPQDPVSGPDAAPISAGTGPVSGSPATGRQPGKGPQGPAIPPQLPASPGDVETGNGRDRMTTVLRRMKNGLITFSKFVGPGFLVAVSYSRLCPMSLGLCSVTI